MISAAILKKELEKFFDDKSPNFISAPQNLLDAANKWANAFDIYAKGVTPPSTSSNAAKLAFIGVFVTSIVPGSGLIIIPQAFQAYTVALALGMAPTFIATPPIIPPPIQPAFAIGMAGGPASAILQAMVTIIDIWFRTGIAVNALSGTSTIWS